MQDGLKQQKSELDVQMDKQLQLCDKLLKEKTELTKKITTLAEELRMAEKKFLGKLDEVDEAHRKELARQKQNWVSLTTGNFSGSY
jgi:hypothetical protein